MTKAIYCLKRIHRLYLFFFLGMFGMPVGAMADYDEYVLTEGYYSETVDLGAAAKLEFGPNAVVADWIDIKHTFEGEVGDFCDYLGLTNYQDNAYCLCDGEKWWGYDRHYFIERHNGDVPSGWLVHDHIDNHTLDLGSWYDLSMRILVKLTNPVPDIKANGLDGFVELYQGDSLDISISLEAGSAGGDLGEIWITAIRLSDFGLWWYLPPNWIKSFTSIPSYQGLIPDIEQVSIIDSSIPYYVIDTYLFYFILDLKMDGILNTNYLDYVLVNINEETGPWIDFTHVPEYGSFDDLRGIVGNVVPTDYRVAVYIMVEGLWWTKPTFAHPLTVIEPDGTWTCDITTGGYDQFATEIAAFLLPEGIDPPICAGSVQFPDVPEAVALKHIERGPETRILSFAGYDWTVKRSDFPIGPGPNYFSDSKEDVWVDNDGLHLTISKQSGKWYCSEVIINESFGYGTYIFQTNGRVDIIDPMMVLGLFTWDTEAPASYFREIDIEFSRWGDPLEYTNSQYVVQPWYLTGHLHRFRVDLDEEEKSLTHYIVWQPGTVEFRSYYGNYIDQTAPLSALSQKWTHTSGYVPEPGKENVRFNYWLYEGAAPHSGLGDELVVTGFKWQEEPPDWE